MGMDCKKLKEAQQWIKDELTRCIDFWLKNGLDREHGGVYTCLDRTGKVYSTDKSVWMQGRAAWTFSRLCTLYGKRPEWMEMAESCLDFLEKHCINREAGNRLYFTVTADGKPLRQRRHSGAELFYAMANAEYYSLTGEPVRLERARRAYDMFWDLWHGAKDPTGLGPKTIPETRSGRSFGKPMSSAYMASMMLRVDPERSALYEARATECIDIILRYHYHPEFPAVLENVGPNGEARLDFTEGRILNPGHAIEGTWFLLEHAKRKHDRALLAKCEDLFNCSFDRAWDKEYGGMLYFTDVCGLPPESYEHDMKLWWPHNETLICSLMLYDQTGKEEYLDKFYLVLDYCKNHFADPEYGEWYGYLRRDGKPTMPPAKGSTFKGPFHLPRMLSIVDKLCDRLLSQNQAKENS